MNNEEKEKEKLNFLNECMRVFGINENLKKVLVKYFTLQAQEEQNIVNRCEKFSTEKSSICDHTSFQVIKWTAVGRLDMLRNMSTFLQLGISEELFMPAWRKSKEEN